MNRNDVMVTFQVVNDQVNNAEFIVFVVILWPVAVKLELKNISW